MQGIKRRVIYVVFYELITLLIISTAFSFFSGKDAGHSTTLGVVVVMLAVVWNTVYNTLFEMWEKNRQARGRSLVRRVLHAIGFEIGFVAITLPLFAWWLEMTLLDVSTSPKLRQT